jgi:hypothetical protein
VPLSDDQKAMLRVLAQREEGYEDMAALMGISVEELRRRVKEALSEVEDDPGAAEPAPVPLSPPEPAPAPVAAPAPPPAPTPPAAAAPTPRRSRPSGLKLPKDRGALIGLGAGVLALIAMAIVLVVSDGGSSSPTTPSEGNVASFAESAAQNPNLTNAILTPAQGGEGEGIAIFGRLRKAVVLEVVAKDLEPSEPGQSYAVWLSHSGKAMVPMGTTKVQASGDLGARLEVTPAILVLVAKQAFNQVDITRVTDSQLSAAVATARKQKAESAYTGTPVLSGQISGPLIHAAKQSSR